MDRRSGADRLDAHVRQPSSLSTDFSRLNNTSLMSDPTRYQSAIHIRQMSNVDSQLSAARRGSYQSDTTSRMLDRDARSIRVRTSDIFGVKPNLRFKDNTEYRAMPDGHLPTLKGQSKATFVDQIADELDTHQLRNVLDTDSRRRKRRQSAIEFERRHHGSLSAARQSRIQATKQERALRDSTKVEIIKTAPVYNNSTVLPPHGASDEDDTKFLRRNTITGIANDWHEVDQPDLRDAAGSSQQEPGIILAGNRESFPDFAVLDRRDPVRASNSGSFLTTAWTSLWRRASTARTRKEIDVAQHRDRTLREANKRSQEEARSYKTAPSPPVSREASLNKHLSAGSSVLYETLDDLTLSNPPQRQVAVPDSTMTTAGDVPLDAFYDARSNAGSAARTTHSRNFSRPTNDSRQDFYSRTIDQKLRSDTSPSNNKSFSPLLNGDSFPRPENREAANTIRVMHQIAADRSSGTIRGYSTPAQAAGLVQSSYATFSTPLSQCSNGVRALNGHTHTSTTLPRGDKVALQVHTDNPRMKLNVMRASASSDTFDGGATPTAQKPETESCANSADGGMEDPSILPEFEDESDYEKGIWRTGIGKPVQIVNSTDHPPVLYERSQLPSSFPTSRRSSDTRRSSEDLKPHLSRVSSHQGELDFVETQPPALVKHDSYMTSVNSFYTADGYLTNESATSSRETLTQGTLA